MADNVWAIHDKWSSVGPRMQRDLARSQKVLSSLPSGAQTELTVLRETWDWPAKKLAVMAIHQRGYTDSEKILDKLSKRPYNMDISEQELDALIDMLEREPVVGLRHSEPTEYQTLWTAPPTPEMETLEPSVEETPTDYPIIVHPEDNES